MLGWFVALMFAAPPSWSSLVGSPSGAVALADEHEVRLSLDHGVTWIPVLAGDDGNPTTVDALTLADDGALYVARGARLGVRTVDGHEHWSRLPGRHTSLLAANGGRVAWLGETGEGDEWRISLDGGASFKARPQWSTGNNANGIALSANGRVQIVWGMEAPCGGGYQGRAIGRIWDEELRVAEFPYDVPYDWQPSASGWLYVQADCVEDDGAMHWCAVSPTGETHHLPAFMRGDADVLLAVEGPRAWLLSGSELAVARGRGARTVSRDVPTGARVLAVAQGEPWILTDDHRLLALRDGLWVDAAPR